MPNIGLLVNHKMSIKSQMPIPPVKGHKVPSGFKKKLPIIGYRGNQMWREAAEGVAVVGVMSMKTGNVYIRPLVPRPIDVSYVQFSLGGTKVRTGEPAGKMAGQTLKYEGRSYAYLEPIQHNKGGSSHHQLSSFSMVEEKGGVREEDFLGFSLTKRSGSHLEPHLLAQRSNTLNAKFISNGITIPKDWSDLLRQILGRFLTA